MIDTGWAARMARFLGSPRHFPSLDQELHAEFEPLRAARAEMDDEIERVGHQPPPDASIRGLVKRRTTVASRATPASIDSGVCAL
jgi:hypothetical protein